MAKNVARDRARRILLEIPDYPNLKAVWVESCRKRRNIDKYDLVLRTEDDITGDDVLAAGDALGGDAGALSSGFEGGYDGGSSYIEFDVAGATLPT